MFGIRFIIGRAWRLVTAQKRLLFFGLFASSLGVSGELLALFRYGGMVISPLDELPFPFGFLAGIAIWSYWATLFAARPIVISALLAIILGIVALVVWLGFCMLGGIYSASALSFKKKQIALRTHFHIGRRSCWRMVSLFIASRGVIYLVIFVANVVYLSFWQLGFSGMGFYALGFAMLFIETVIVGITLFLLRFAQIATILHDASLQESVRRAWRLLRQYWLQVVEVSVAVLALDALAFLILSYLLSPLALLVYYAFDLGREDLVLQASGIGALLFLFFFLIIASVLAVFHAAIWTSLYEFLHDERAQLTSITRNSFRDAFAHLRKYAARQTSPQQNEDAS